MCKEYFLQQQRRDRESWNLVLRYSVPQFPPNCRGLTCWVAELNASLCLVMREIKIGEIKILIFHSYKWESNPQSWHLQSHAFACAKSGNRCEIILKLSVRFFNNLKMILNYINWLLKSLSLIISVRRWVTQTTIKYPEYVKTEWIITLFNQCPI